ncbi:MAG TPA: restriction endonuclease subunit S [Anaerolineales bacterium]|nr:restriction endonuclease subunit S [Anaerolineales bacterium]
MTKQDALFFQPHQYTLTKDLVTSLISLLDLQNKSKVLVIEFGTQISGDTSLDGHDIVYIQNSEPHKELVKKIETNGPYDGVILLPVFSSLQTQLKPPTGWEVVGKFTTEDWLIAHAFNNLKSSGSITALVPNGLLTNHGRQIMRRELINCGLVMVSAIPTDLIYRDLKRVQVSTALLLVRNGYQGSDRQITFVNFGNYATLPSKDDWVNITAGEMNLDDDIVRVHIPNLKDHDYRLDPQYYDPAYLQIKAPQGFVEVSLDEIADIRGGFMAKKEERTEIQNSENSLPYLQVRHILNNGTIASHPLWVDSTQIPSFKERVALPGDILVTVAGTIGKAVLVPVSYGKGVFFDTSIRRIRISDESIKPEWVFQFFQSEIGQLQFRRLTSGSTIPQITTPVLETMSIFLPTRRGETGDVKGREAPTDISDNRAQANLIASAIQENVVDYLRNINPHEENWNENIEKTLSNLIKNLIPKPLDKLILEDFPTPIAIPYRRFNMARYNYYERLDRMISLVESCVYLVFHVLLTDYCRHHWKNQINLSNEARQSLKGTQSIDYRLRFIDEVLNYAQSGSINLFMPELSTTEIVEIGNKLRNEVRNPISHSAPGSEPFVRSLIDKYAPSVTKLLESFRFLSDYTLCRVRNHYFQNGEWYYQAEIYRGAEYDLNIQENILAGDSNDSELITAERDHLILLSPDAETLDMHPFYQLYFGNETARESHLCFYKHRQGNRLVGESIRSSVEVTLLGIEDFQTLTGVNIGSSGQDIQ